MAAMHIRPHTRQLTLLPLALIALSCVTDPDGVASVSASPSNLSFASIHAPAQTLTVTVTGTNGKTRTDVPVTWTYWESYGDPIASSRVIIIERDGTGANTFRVRPFGLPGVSFFYANAGGKRSAPLGAVVNTGPSVALAFERQPPTTAQSGVPIPFGPRLWTVDADGFQTSSELPITASIASGNGTLSGTTTANTLSGSAAAFNNLVIQGTGVFTLRFSSPGLTPIVSNPITMSGAITSATRCGSLSC